MKTDIEIAQEAKLEHIKDVAATIGIQEDDLEFYGKYKAKLSDDLSEKIKDNEDGKLVLVTAINPTPAGEGKTTTTVGLGEAMAKAEQESAYRSPRAFSGAMFRYQRWRCRRRICTGGSYGGSESSLYRGFSRYYFR